MSHRDHRDVDWIHRLILPCAEVARLLGDPQRPPLTLGYRIRLRVHLALCAFCSRYQRQVHRLRAALQRQPRAGEAAQSTGLSRAARDRIRESLRR